MADGKLVEDVAETLRKVRGQLKSREDEVENLSSRCAIRVRLLHDARAEIERLSDVEAELRAKIRALQKAASKDDA